MNSELTDELNHTLYEENGSVNFNTEDSDIYLLHNEIDILKEEIYQVRKEADEKITIWKNSALEHRRRLEEIVKILERSQEDNDNFFFKRALIEDYEERLKEMVDQRLKFSREDNEECREMESFLSQKIALYHEVLRKKRLACEEVDVLNISKSSTSNEAKSVEGQNVFDRITDRAFADNSENRDNNHLSVSDLKTIGSANELFKASLDFGDSEKAPFSNIAPIQEENNVDVYKNEVLVEENSELNTQYNDKRNREDISCIDTKLNTEFESINEESQLDIYDTEKTEKVDEFLHDKAVLPSERDNNKHFSSLELTSNENMNILTKKYNELKKKYEIILIENEEFKFQIENIQNLEGTLNKLSRIFKILDDNNEVDGNLYFKDNLSEFDSNKDKICNFFCNLGPKGIQNIHLLQYFYKQVEILESQIRELEVENKRLIENSQYTEDFGISDSIMKENALLKSVQTKLTRDYQELEKKNEILMKKLEFKTGINDMSKFIVPDTLEMKDESESDNIMLNSKINTLMDEKAQLEAFLDINKNENESLRLQLEELKEILESQNIKNEDSYKGDIDNYRILDSIAISNASLESSIEETVPNTTQDPESIENNDENTLEWSDWENSESEKLGFIDKNLDEIPTFQLSEDNHSIKLDVLSKSNMDILKDEKVSIKIDDRDNDFCIENVSETRADDKVTDYDAGDGTSGEKIGDHDAIPSEEVNSSLVQICFDIEKLVSLEKKTEKIIGKKKLAKEYFDVKKLKWECIEDILNQADFLKVNNVGARDQLISAYTQESSTFSDEEDARNNSEVSIEYLLDNKIESKSSYSSFVDTDNTLRFNTDYISEENRVLQSNYDLIVNENNELKSNIDNIKSENNELQYNYDLIINENKELRSNIDNITSENDELKSNIDNIKSENDELKSNIDNIRIENNELKSNIDNIKNENDELKSNIDNITSENNELKSNIDNIRIENNELQYNYDLIINENKELRSNIDNITSENDELKSNIDNITSENNELKSNIDNIKNENKELQYNYDLIINENNELKSNIDNIRIENNELKYNYDLIINENNELKSNIDNITNENNELKLEENTLLSKGNNFSFIEFESSEKLVIFYMAILMKEEILEMIKVLSSKNKELQSIITFMKVSETEHQESPLTKNMKSDKPKDYIYTCEEMNDFCKAFFKDVDLKFIDNNENIKNKNELILFLYGLVSIISIIDIFYRNCLNILVKLCFTLESKRTLKLNTVDQDVVEFVGQYYGFGNNNYNRVSESRISPDIGLYISSMGDDYFKLSAIYELLELHGVKVEESFNCLGKVIGVLKSCEDDIKYQELEFNDNIKTLTLVENKSSEVESNIKGLELQLEDSLKDLSCGCEELKVFVDTISDFNEKKCLNLDRLTCEYYDFLVSKFAELNASFSSSKKVISSKLEEFYDFNKSKFSDDQKATLNRVQSILNYDELFSSCQDFLNRLLEEFVIFPLNDILLKFHTVSVENKEDQKVDVILSDILDYLDRDKNGMNKFESDLIMMNEEIHQICDLFGEDYDRCMEERSELQKKVIELKVDIGLLKEEISRLKSELDAVQCKFASCNSEIETNKENHEKILTTYKLRIEEIEGEKEAIKDNYMELEKEKEELVDKLNESLVSYSKLQQEFSDQAYALRNTDIELVARVSEIEVLRGVLNALKEQYLAQEKLIEGSISERSNLLQNIVQSSIVE